MRREFGAFGEDILWDFYGTEEEWVQYQLALMAADQMPDDEVDD